jgi:hypothetical protein
MHKSQGVGGLPRRECERNIQTAGLVARTTNSIFDMVDTSWSRVPNSQAVAADIRQSRRSIPPIQPHPCLGY